MHICLISQEYPPDTNWGGIATYTQVLARQLAKTGHRVSVITLAEGDEYATDDMGVSVHRVSRNPKSPFDPAKLDELGGLNHGVLYLSQRIYEKVLEIHHEDPIEVIEAPETCAQAVLTFKRLEGVVKITRLHTPFFWVRQLNNMPETPEHLVRDQLEKLQVELSTAVTSPTRAMAEVVRSRWGTENIDVIPNFFNLKTYTPDLGAYRSLLEGKEYLLFFGRLEYRKGVQVLAEALPALLDQVPGISVAFVGSDSVYNQMSMKEYLKLQLQGYEDRYLFIDNIPHAQLYPLIERAKLVVLPSLWENFPYVCLEAMSLAKAVVASDSGGFPEIIESGREGVLVPPGDPAALSAALKECLASGDLEGLGRRAREKAATFDTEKVVAEMAGYYASLCAKRGAGRKESRLQGLKVAYVVRHIPVPSETFVINEIIALQSLGPEVHPISLLPAQKCHDELMSRIGVAVTDLSPGEVIARGAQSPNFPAAERVAQAFGVSPTLTRQAALVADYIGEHGIDHLHAHFATESAFVALVAAKVAGISCTFTSHAYDIFRDENTGTIAGDTPQKRLDILLRESDGGYTISEYNRRYILSRTDQGLADRIGIVRCGIDLDSFQPVPRDGRDSVTILCVGRFVEKKGYEYLLRAFARLAMQGGKVRLRLVGDGDLKGAMEQLAQELGVASQVDFLGSVSTEVVLREMVTADIFALHSVTAANGDMEGIPVSLMEASATGLPVLTTLHSGIPELVQDGVTGFLVPERDVDAFYQKLALLASSAELRGRLGRAGREHVMVNFNQRREAEKLAERFATLKDRRQNVKEQQKEKSVRPASTGACLVDIIMPTFNPDPVLLSRAIRSIVDQEFQDWRLYVVKDGGDVDIKDVVAAFEDPRIELFELPHGGKPVALNYALGRGSAKYIAYQDDDDIWYPNHLTTVIGYMEETGVEFVHTECHEVTVERNGRDIREISRKALSMGILTDKTLVSISHINAAHSRRVVELAGPYDVDRRFFIDWDMFLRMAAVSRPVHLKTFTCEHFIYLGADKKHKNTITGIHKNDPELSVRMQKEMFRRALELQTPDDFSEFVFEFMSKAWHLERRKEEVQELTQKVARLDEQLQDARLAAGQGGAALPAAAAGSPDELPRLIAFYLPQYHPIPENDKWWGKGFTEWRNVSKAKPLFPGHYQPHIPADLGFYDLRLEETRVAQAELAREYGINGFCYYHYWFNGKRLLERPLEDLLKSGKPDFPFCICWATENWTRRWDGQDQHVLMELECSEEDDRRHLRELVRIFEDPRYIRVNGKPMFLVYRTENLPDPKRSAEIWRDEARAAGLGEIYLVRVESIGACDPASIGFDAALEFAPDWNNKGPRVTAESAGTAGPGMLKEKAEQVFRNNYVHRYDDLVRLMEEKPTPDYTWFRCVTPSWDNSARRQEGATIFIDSTPGKYEAWLESAIRHSKRHQAGDERLVFVNAWNEWAEGNHLEPDHLHGRGYLEATRSARAHAQDSERLKEQAKVLQALRRQLAEQERLIQEYRSQAEDRQALLAESERLLTEKTALLQQSEQRVRDLLNSASWKVTGPLRWGYEQIKKKG